jgi:hypothetical protein
MREPMTDDHTALARQALLEITPESTVGAFLDTVDEGDGVVSVRFANTMPGYPGWRWTVSVAHVEGDAPTVLEVELMPGDGSLVAPEWVPWSERLADWRAAQGDDHDEHDDESDDDESDDDDDLDESDEDGDDEESDEDEDDDDLDDDDEDTDDEDADEDDLDDDLGDDEFDGVDVEQAAAASHGSDDEE